VLWLLLPILLVAAWLRFHNLLILPPGLHFDLAFNAFDIARLWGGDYRIFFPANTGREPLFIYLQAASASIFGLEPFSLRLVSAFIGVLTIPLVYRFAADLLRSRAIGLIAALVCGISFWHIFYSRDGLRVILVVPLTILTFWMLWRGLMTRRSREFALCGIFVALAFYTYVSARLLPVAVTLVVLYAVRTDRYHAAEYLSGLGIALMVTVVAVAPLGIYFLLHPDEFLSHSLQVSIIAPEVSQGNVMGVLGQNAWAVLNMFLVTGDGASIRNLPRRPVFDPLLGALFVSGVVVWIASLIKPSTTRHLRLASVLLGVWLFTSLGTSLFSDDAPNFLRTLTAMPVVAVLAAWGTVAIWQRLSNPLLRRAFVLFCTVVLLVSAWFAYEDYFVVYASRPELFFALDVDKVEIADWINAHAPTAHIYLAPLLYQQGTVSFLTRNSIFRSFDSRDTLVLPPREAGKDAYYAFPLEQARRIETLGARLGVGERVDLNGSNGLPLLLVYRVPVDQLPSASTPLDRLDLSSDFLRISQGVAAEWPGRLRLHGVRVVAHGAGSRQLLVTLYVQATESIAEDLTFSVKVRDEAGRAWGQQDKMPGSNSYPTSSWTPGELVVERFQPEFDECPPPGIYGLTLEVYDLDSGLTLSVAGAEGNMVGLGTVQLKQDCSWETRVVP
jgi:4-amino-4-deoxy-L-arabinose transferase-like glycosyltransferase